MTSSPNEWLREVLRSTKERSERASEVYSALKVTGRISSVRRLTYRCERRCSLLDVVESPEGVIIGFPRYKTSPVATEQTSNEDGRLHNTEDGFRRWKQHAAFAETVSNPPLSCDHLHNVALPDAALEADFAAGHTEVRVRPDGSRYAQ